MRKLIDLSCLGEFETCKALCNLVNLDYVRASHRPGQAACEPTGNGACSEGAPGLGRVWCASVVVLAAVLLRSSPG